MGWSERKDHGGKCTSNSAAALTSESRAAVQTCGDDVCKQTQLRASAALPMWLKPSLLCFSDPDNSLLRQSHTELYKK